MDSKKYTMIRILQITAFELKEIGKKSETYDEVLKRLIGIYKKTKQKDK